MTIAEICTCGAGGLVVIMTLIQVAPLKWDPWTAIGKALGRAINADVMKELETLKADQRGTRERLEGHIAEDAKKGADDCRARVLQFNSELYRGTLHTEEDYVEILQVIDHYEAYCRDHPDYPNNRAVHAVANIKRNYDERLIKRDFLGEGAQTS